MNSVDLNRKYIPEYVWNITYADDGYLDKMQCEFNNGIVKIDIDWSEKQIKYQRTYSLKCPVNEAPFKDEILAENPESFLLDFVEFDDKGRWTKANEYLYDIVTDQMVICRIYSSTFYPGEQFDEWDKENSSEIECDF